MTAPRAPAGYYPVTGYRHRDTGTMNLTGENGHRWSSTLYAASPIYVTYFLIDVTRVVPAFYADRSAGLGVRCLQAFTSDLVSHMLAFPFAVFVIPKRSEGSSAYHIRKIPHFVSG